MPRQKRRPLLYSDAITSGAALLRDADQVGVPYGAMPSQYASVRQIKRLLKRHGLNARHFQPLQNGAMWFTVEDGEKAVAVLRSAGFWGGG